MSVKIAGIPVTLVTPEIAQFINTGLNQSNIDLMTNRAFLGPKLASTSYPVGYRKWPHSLEIGTFVWPSDASRWAYSVWFVDAPSLSLMADAAFGDPGSSSDPDSSTSDTGCRSPFRDPIPGPEMPPQIAAMGYNNMVTFTMDSTPQGTPNYEQINTCMFMLPPLPISAFAGNLTPPATLPPTDGNTFATPMTNGYVVILVDKRYYWWNFSTQATGIQTTGTPWASLISNAGAIVGETITVDAIDPAYLKASPDMNLYYEALPPYMDALAANVGKYVCVDINTGRVSMQGYPTAKQARIDDDESHPYRHLRAGNYRFQDQL